MTASRTTGRRRAALLGAGLLCAAAALAGPVRPAATEAAWTTAQRGAVAVTAGLTAPTGLQCAVTTHVVVLVGAVLKDVTLTWTSPYPLSMQRVYFGTQPGGKTPTASGPTGGMYGYSVQYDYALLNSLVANLLGSTTPVRVRAEAGTNTWSSPEATKSLRVELLGLSPSCT